MDNPSSLRITDLNKIKELGKGQFGKVFLAEHKEKKGFLVAVKECSLKISKRAQTYLFREIGALGSLNHQNINKFYGYDANQNTQQLFIFLEYCNGGDLQNAIDDYKKTYNKPLSEETAQYLLRQIVAGLQAMHNKNIVHRDLKPGNFLLHYENEEDRINKNLLKANVQIADLGFAKILAPGELTETTLGTPFFADPRIFLSKNERYGKEVDIWSLGIISFQLLTGNLPFIAKNFDGLGNKIAVGEFSFKSSSKLSEESISFIQCSLQENYKLRWDINDLARHYFLVRRVNRFTPVLDRRKNEDGSVKLNIHEMEQSLVDKNVMKARMLDESIKASVPEKLEESREGTEIINKLSLLMLNPKKQIPIKKNSVIKEEVEFNLTPVIENKLKKSFDLMNQDFIYYKPKIIPSFPYESPDIKEFQFDIRTDLNN